MYAKPAYVVERVHFNDREIEVANDAWGVVAIIIIAVEVIANAVPPTVA